MAVQVNLMVNQSDNIVVNKTLATYKMGINATLKDSTELLTPSLAFSKDLEIELSEFNYLYIPDFNRYYYVTNSSKELGGVIRVDGKVDVLMSHKKEILNLGAIVERQQYLYNLFLETLNIPNMAYSRFQTFEFSQSPFTADTCVLLTNGK